MSVSSPAADTDRVGGLELESEFESTARRARGRRGGGAGGRYGPRMSGRDDRG